MSKAISKPSSRSGTPIATLRVLGGFDLRNADDQPIELKARKNRQLLAYLAIPSGQTRSREQLAALLWGDRQEEQARGSLRTALSGIRRTIGDDALIVEHDTVSLRSGYLDTDYENLKKLSANDTHISKLGDFYAGEFLYGQEHDSELFMDWLRGLRTEVSDVAQKILEKNAERFVENSDNASAISLLRDCLSLEPLKEQTHRTIMELHAANGEKAMALAQFRTCKEVLLHELDAGPDPETQALADSIALRDVSVSKELRKQAALIPETPTKVLDSNITSIAVLPFVNMSADAEQNYFADGITEDIIVDLSEFESLSIAAKSSSDTYRGVAILPLSISNELGVRYLLEGSVRRTGDNVRISARLFDAVENRQILAKRYDRELDDIFELQSDISKEIVNSLKINLKLADDDTSNAQTTTSAEAYQYYLHAKSLLKSDNRSNTVLAATLFESAVAVDPDYALAYAELARCEVRLADHLNLSGVELDAALAKAQDNCEKALRINPTLVEAYLAQGNILSSAKDISAAKDNYSKALALNPKSAEALSSLGYYYIAVEGDLEKAFTYAQKAYAIDPDRACSVMLLTCLNGLDKPEELQSAARKVLKREKLRIAVDPYDFSAVHLVAFASYLLGDTDEAIHWTNIATAFDLDHRVSIYNLACLHSMLGSIDNALETLERSLKIPSNPEMISYAKNVDPDLELARKDPRFKELFAHYEV